MYSESDLLPLSALQHIAFCERQCALIHIEQIWEENRLTAEGRILHEKVHNDDTETRGGMRIARGLKLRSFSLGISGIADVVEFHREDIGIVLPGILGLWQPFPVEYKRGKPKPDNCDKVQLCAQAMCLEEMLKTKITAGSLYYGSQHKRYGVIFEEPLRNEVRVLSERLHELINSNKTPKAEYRNCCEKCSLLNVCMPESTDKTLEKYLSEIISSIEEPIFTTGEGN
jgi:CRISPR-associated exonuclease Cas4